MFFRWGQFSYAHRRIIPLLIIAAIAVVFAVFGTKLDDRLSQEGWEDPRAASTTAAEIEAETFGRDRNGDVILLFDNPQEHLEAARAHLNYLQEQYPDQIAQVTSYFDTRNPNLLSDDGSVAFAAIGLAGDDEQTLRDFRTIQDDLTGADTAQGLDIEVAGATAVADALDDGMAHDISVAERAALPLVGLLLLFVFGSVIAAFMPLIVGALSIMGSIGILSVLAGFIQVNVFSQAVVTLLGLGLAIDYGLFMVSRFREELDKGRDTRTAVAITTATAGQTVVFSALMVAVAISSLLIFPQAFLKSVAYGAISAVGLAALLSVTVLPAIFGMLGHNIDKWTVRKTKRSRPIEETFWYRVPRWAMSKARWFTVGITALLLALTIPLLGVSFGGVNETYLPPSHETRQAQDRFNEEFPEHRTEPIKLVVKGADNQQLVDVVLQAREVQGLTSPMAPSSQTIDGTTVLSAGIADREDNAEVIEQLRAITAPEGVDLYVGGTPAMEVESLEALFEKLPWMALYVIVATFLLMAAVFGSLIIPAKAIIMTVLTLGATLGILTGMFVLGAGSGLLDFSPGPLMSPILVLIIAIIYGLSTDYEVFLVSRMVEARKRGASTDDAINYGTAHTGHIITAAALIMIVVAGAFGFSDIVMMKYIAFGMIFALFLDATIVRMFLVPAVMHLLREDNWWAPAFVHRIYERMGHGAYEETVVPAGRMADASGPEGDLASDGAYEQYDLAPENGLALDGGHEQYEEQYELDKPHELHESEVVADNKAIRSGRTTDQDSDLIPFSELMKRLENDK